jgi:hypothetical protein
MKFLLQHSIKWYIDRFFMSQASKRNDNPKYLNKILKIFVFCLIKCANTYEQECTINRL